jgi:hypothetical protein
MVNHTKNEDHYTVAIITWLIILGMNTIILNHTRNAHHYTVVIIT